MKKEQQILLKISNSIISTLDYEKVLQIISDGMAELMEIETAAIYLLQGKKDLYLSATTPPLDPNTPEGFREADLKDHPHVTKALKSKKSILLEDALNADLSPAEKIVVEIRKLRTLIFLPFIHGKSVLGILILGTSNKARNFTKEEVELGQTVANQLSVGIQNARLHHDLQLKNESLIQEIQERKKIENELRKSEAHLSNALLIGKLGHWEYDVKNDFFTFTDEFYEIYKTSAKKESGYNMSSEEYAKRFVHSEDQNAVQNEILTAIETKDQNYSAEVSHRIIYKTGKEGYIIVRYKVSKDKKGDTVKIYGVNQDITNQKKIEKELKDHRDNLEILVKEKTRELDILIEELKAANDELQEKNSIINNQNEELLATLSSLKETQARLIQSEKMASLGTLTAGVAHEINNPLNYIMGSYVVLKNYFKKEPCNNQEYVDDLLEKLKSGLDKSTNIVSGLNQFSRDNKSLDEDCDINSIIENCLIMLNHQIKNRIDIKRFYSNKDVIIKGNAGQLHQAFTNILTNAVQAIEDKGTITLKSETQNGNIIIDISDTGMGIPHEYIAKITDPFFTTKNPGEGTGLGLSITYSIIKDHKGKMEFNSELNKGTTVKITFSKN